MVVEHDVKTPQSLRCTQVGNVIVSTIQLIPTLLMPVNDAAWGYETMVFSCDDNGKITKRIRNARKNA